uniref:Ankyrin-like protein n=1 Tax=Oryza sativa subsp. japonica TaxID=39947 RepID=Q6EQ80_ORYSJ|nr:ankyrin-like protein [Oryza sativa Japonica Group]BAD29190.1 ankyrin-like protein [Oryza sativa Japonica Group]
MEALSNDDGGGGCELLGLGFCIILLTPREKREYGNENTCKIAHGIRKWRRPSRRRRSCHDPHGLGSLRLSAAEGSPEHGRRDDDDGCGDAVDQQQRQSRRTRRGAAAAGCGCRRRSPTAAANHASPAANGCAQRRSQGAYEVQRRPPHHIIHMHEGAPAPPSAHVVDEEGRQEVSVEDDADGHQRSKCTDGVPAAPQASAADVEEDSVHHENISKLISGFVPPALGAPILDEVTTYDGDSALHVVAACADTEDYLKCARMIYNKASRLLDAINSEMDTPLHCALAIIHALRAGNIGMVSCLIELAAGEQNYHHGAGWKVKDLLRRMNKHGETVLHAAIRSGNKMLLEKLMSEDPELVCVPRMAHHH